MLHSRSSLQMLCGSGQKASPCSSPLLYCLHCSAWSTDRAVWWATAQPGHEKWPSRNLWRSVFETFNKMHVFLKFLCFRNSGGDLSESDYLYLESMCHVWHRMTLLFLVLNFWWGFFTLSSIFPCMSFYPSSPTWKAWERKPVNLTSIPNGLWCF